MAAAYYFQQELLENIVKNINTEPFDSFVGPCGYYKYANQKIMIQKTNEAYDALFRGINVEWDAKHPIPVIEEDDAIHLKVLFTEALAAKERKSFRVEKLYKSAEQKNVWLQMECFLVKQEGQESYFLIRGADVSKEYEQEYILEEMQQRIVVLERMRGNTLYEFIVNLTTDQVEESLDTKKWLRDSQLQSYSYEEGCRYIAEKLPDENSRREFLKFTDANRLKECFAKNSQWVEILDYRHEENEETKWRRAAIYSLPNDSTGNQRVYCFINDIHEAKCQDLELIKQAATDELTGLLNRHYSIPRVDDYIAKHPEDVAALIIFDVDEFKAINDGFGHAKGDEILREVAKKIRSHFRDNDIVCRLGGDEFMVFCRHMDEESTELRLNSILKDANCVFRSKDKEYRFSLSAGYAMFPKQGSSFDELYQKADVALYASKENGKNMFHRYAAGMKEIRNKEE